MTTGSQGAQAPTTEQIRSAWDALATGFDEFVTPLTMAFGEQIISRLDLAPGTRFLDVGAGSGALAIAAARRGAEVTAIDISPAMVAGLNARARDEALTNLEGLEMDGEDLGFSDAAFDLSASLNGVSLFPDPEAGLAGMVRVTKPGGRVVVACFGGGPHRAEFVSFFMSAVQTAVPGSSLLPPGPLLPFQLADPERLRAVLRQAGLKDVRVENATWDVTVQSTAHYWEAVTSSNPIAARVAAGLAPRQRDEVMQVLGGMLREHGGGESVAVLRSETNIGLGRR